MKIYYMQKIGQSGIYQVKVKSEEKKKEKEKLGYKVYKEVEI